MNTKNQGQVSILVLENRKEKKFLGIIYEFAIVLEGKDPVKLREDLLEAGRGYVTAVRTANLPDKLLDKSDQLPKEYKELFEEFEHRVIEKKSSVRLSNEYEEAIQTGRAQLAMACV